MVNFQKKTSVFAFLFNEKQFGWRGGRGEQYLENKLFWVFVYNKQVFCMIMP